jgi:hypothetical protein
MACFNGPNVLPQQPPCNDMLFAWNSDVDMSDFAELQRTFTGSRTPLGDLDGDTDVDADDLALFGECMAGPGNPNAGCAPDRFQRADLYRDGGVELADFAFLQTICTGPGN